MNVRMDVIVKRYSMRRVGDVQVGDGCVLGILFLSNDFYDVCQTVKGYIDTEKAEGLSSLFFLLSSFQNSGKLSGTIT